MAFTDPRRITARYDRILTQLENEQLQEMQRLLRTTQGRMEHELSRVYQTAYKEGASQSIAWREDRARRMLEDVDRALGEFTPTKRLPKTKAIKSIVQESRQLGLESGRELLSLVDPKAKPVPGVVRAQLETLDVRLESVAAAVRTSQARLVNHAAAAQLKINESVVQGLMRGQGWQKTAAELRAATGMLYYQAERIVRTESLSNNDLARREMYADHGVEYVQRIATQDDRVCEYCAYRAGNVYKINEAPAALHPNDRCYNMPWKPEWQALGLTNDEFFDEHRKGIKQAVEADGRKMNRGRAPFERMNDLTTPKAIWTPGVGQTKFGKEVLGDVSALLLDWTPPPPAKPGPKPGSKKKAPVPMTKDATATASSPKVVKPKQSDEFIPLSEGDAGKAVGQQYTQMKKTAQNQADWFTDNYDRYDERNFRYNRMLFGEIEPDAIAGMQLRNFQDLVASRVAPANMRVYRGYTLPKGVLPPSADLGKMVGTQIKDNRFVLGSTRASHVNQALSNTLLGANRDAVSMEIRLRQGQTRGFTVFTKNSFEPGFILPHGSELRIVEARALTGAGGEAIVLNGSRRVHLVAEVVFDATKWTGQASLKVAQQQWKVMYGGAAGIAPATTQAAAAPPPPPPKPAVPAGDRQNRFKTKDPLRGYEERELYSASVRMEQALSQEQIRGVSTYSGGAYSEINRALRSGAMPSDSSYRTAVTRVRSALAEPVARLPEKTLLHRGYSIPNEMLPTDVHKMIGTTITDLGFVSTTTRASTAHSFMRMNLRSGRTGIVMRVRGKKGTRGLAIESFSQHSSEREFLLADGTKFRVVDARKLTVEEAKSMAYREGTDVIELVVEVVQ